MGKNNSVKKPKKSKQEVEDVSQSLEMSKTRTTPGSNNSSKS